MGNKIYSRRMAKGDSDKDTVLGATEMGTGGDLDAAVLASTNFSDKLSYKLSIGFKAEDLPNSDTMSLSDPFVVLFKKQGIIWQEIDRTEIIHNNQSPQWDKKILVDFHFEQQEEFKVEQQEEFKVEIYDSVNDQTRNLEDHDFIGSLEFQMHEVVTSGDQIMTKTLINSKRQVGTSGRIVISAEETATTATGETTEAAEESKQQPVVAAADCIAVSDDEQFKKAIAQSTIRLKAAGAQIANEMVDADYRRPDYLRIIYISDTTAGSQQNEILANQFHNMGVL